MRGGKREKGIRERKGRRERGGHRGDKGRKGREEEITARNGKCVEKRRKIKERIG